eukprot:TRINITY_DN7042_c0_g1_i1.p2 TRINITY_DN7042_c0_g1~~TRINITY_DN7042_c0_g1_i1.p2  ORF type:complete len:201 (-),score=39.82 TRINITY_DN7042_c0_g1_i1:362-964(-)
MTVLADSKLLALTRVYFVVLNSGEAASVELQASIVEDLNPDFSYTIPSISAGGYRSAEITVPSEWADGAYVAVTCGGTNNCMPVAFASKDVVAPALFEAEWVSPASGQGALPLPGLTGGSELHLSISLEDGGDAFLSVTQLYPISITLQPSTIHAPDIVSGFQLQVTMQNTQFRFVENLFANSSYTAVLVGILQNARTVS